MGEDASKKPPKVADVNPAAELNDVLVAGTESFLAKSGQTIQAEIVKEEKSVASEQAQNGEVPEGRLLYTIIGNDKLLQSTEIEHTDFIGFIGALRGILADHQDHEDICDRHEDTNLSSSKTHPLLVKLRADQQPARWIQVKLQVVEEDNGTTKSTASTTLVMRDDNLDVIGFRNDNGDWYEVGNRRMLPSQYKVAHCLNWGNSYKSILDVANEEQVANKLGSESLGETYATKAVRVLSCYNYNSTLANGDDNPRLVLVRLMFMICESAKINPVHDAITGTGNGFTKELMTDCVCKYVEMSRRLRHWKKGNYAEPRCSLELKTIYLVLNEEYTIGELLPFAYPETMLKASSPEMFIKVMSMATVQVNLRRLKQGKYDMQCVYGKIAALVKREQHMDNVVYFRVGSMLFTHTEVNGKHCSNSLPPELARFVVAVPLGWVLQIVVDLHVKISKKNKRSKPLNAIFYFDKESETLGYSNEGLQVEVNITWEDNKHYFPPQLISCPVEVYETMCGNPSVVYTIGDDVMSFTEFIMTLRRILADHKNREDILDGHDFLNLCSTGAHPMLGEQHTGVHKEPVRWLRIKLQVEGEEASSTTLVMRYDNLYVHGFFNQNGILFKLREENEGSVPLIPENYHSVSDTKDLKWGFTYPNILKVGRQKNQETSAQIVELLKDKKLGCVSAKDSVRSLSRYTGDDGSDDSLTTGKALVRLLIMVCEPARMNPLHDSIAAGWTNGTEFTEQMLVNYVWKYKDMSQELWTWKSGGYAKRLERKSGSSSSLENKETQPISQLQAIYLVLRPPREKNNFPRQQPTKIKSKHIHYLMDKTSSDGDNDAYSRKPQQANNNHTREGGNVVHSPDDNGQTTSHSTRQSLEAKSGQTSSEEDDDETSEEEENDDQGMEEADDIRGYGRPLVELFSMRADLGVEGTTIIVLDRKRGQIIYRRKENKKGAEQGMTELVLTGPYTGISAFGCFAIKVDIPNTAAGSNSDASGSIKWEWDCYVPEYANEVDKPQAVTRNISSSGPSRKVEVTYAVMSNAREATVKVKLRLKGGHTPVGASGKITALIDGFDVSSILFKCTEEMDPECFSPTNDSWFLLQLARNVVAVPYGKVLHIKADLNTATSNKQEMIDHFNVTLSFANGISSQCHEFNGDQIRVDITWYPEPEVNTIVSGEQESIAVADEQTRLEEVRIEEIGEQGSDKAPALESDRLDKECIQKTDDLEFKEKAEEIIGDPTAAPEPNVLVKVQEVIGDQKSTATAATEPNVKEKVEESIGDKKGTATAAPEPNVQDKVDESIGDQKSTATAAPEPNVQEKVEETSIGDQESTTTAPAASRLEDIEQIAPQPSRPAEIEMATPRPTHRARGLSMFEKMMFENIPRESWKHRHTMSIVSRSDEDRSCSDALIDDDFGPSYMSPLSRNRSMQTQCW